MVLYGFPMVLPMDHRGTGLPPWPSSRLPPSAPPASWRSTPLVPAPTAPGRGPPDGHPTPAVGPVRGPRGPRGPNGAGSEESPEMGGNPEIKGFCYEKTY